MSPVSYLPYQHVPQNCEVTVLTVFNCKKRYIFVEMPTNRWVLHRDKAFSSCVHSNNLQVIYIYRCMCLWTKRECWQPALDATYSAVPVIPLLEERLVL